MVSGVTGWLVEPQDPCELADRVAELLADAVAARRMGEAGRRQVVASFDLDRYVDAMLEAYRTASIAK